MREVTLHHNGDPFNEALKIRALDPVVLGANHHYTIQHNTESTGIYVADIQFQQGPRGAPDSIRGCTTSALLAIVQDHIESFQEGELSCSQNEVILFHLERAQAAIKERFEDRAKRDVLGKLER